MVYYGKRAPRCTCEVWCEDRRLWQMASSGQGWSGSIDLYKLQVTRSRGQELGALGTRIHGHVRFSDGPFCFLGGIRQGRLKPKVSRGDRCIVGCAKTGNK